MSADRCPDCAAKDIKLRDIEAENRRLRQINGNLVIEKQEVQRRLLGAEERILVAQRRYGPGAI